MQSPRFVGWECLETRLSISSQSGNQRGRSIWAGRSCLITAPFIEVHRIGPTSIGNTHRTAASALLSPTPTAGPCYTSHTGGRGTPTALTSRSDPCLSRARRAIAAPRWVAIAQSRFLAVFWCLGRWKGDFRFYRKFGPELI